MDHSHGGQHEDATITAQAKHARAIAGFKKIAAEQAAAHSHGATMAESVTDTQPGIRHDGGGGATATAAEQGRGEAFAHPSRPGLTHPGGNHPRGHAVAIAATQQPGPIRSGLTHNGGLPAKGGSPAAVDFIAGRVNKRPAAGHTSSPGKTRRARTALRRARKGT